MFINQVHHSANHSGLRSDIKPRHIKQMTKSPAHWQDKENSFSHFNLLTTTKLLTISLGTMHFVRDAFTYVAVDISHNLLTSTQGICSGRKCHNISTFFKEQRGNCRTFVQPFKVTHSLHALWYYPSDSGTIMSYHVPDISSLIFRCSRQNDEPLTNWIFHTIITTLRLILCVLWQIVRLNLYRQSACAEYWILT